MWLSTEIFKNSLKNITTMSILHPKVNNNFLILSNIVNFQIYFIFFLLLFIRSGSEYVHIVEQIDMIFDLKKYFIAIRTFNTGSTLNKF